VWPRSKYTLWHLFVRSNTRAVAFAPSLVCLLGGGGREAAAQFVQQQELVADHDNYFNYAGEIGESVALSADGNTAAVTAPGDGHGVGAIYVFTRSSSGVWSQQAKLVSAAWFDQNIQGSISLAISGDGNTILAGTPVTNIVRSFVRSNGLWSEQGTLTASDLAPNNACTGLTEEDNFGGAVALSTDGNTAIVGAPQDNNFAGAAWIFSRSGNTWSEVTRLAANDAISPPCNSSIEEEGQGWAVAISADGTIVLVSSPGDNNGQGAVWAYALSNGTWTEQNKLIGTGGSSQGMAQGLYLALSGDGSTAISAPNFVFLRSGGNWIQRGTLPIPNAVVFGPLALSSDGSVAILGGNQETNNPGSEVFTRHGSSYSLSMPSLAGSGEVAGTEDLPAVAISSDGHTVLQGVFSLNSSAGAAWTFISQSPPVVTGLSPSTGSAAGGTTVIISGQNFLSPATVMFGQNAATSVVVNGTGQITATSPPETPVLTSSQTVDVVVGSNFGLSVANDLDVFTYLPAATPAVTSVAPASGPVAGGTSVAISGSGFLNASAVKFGTNNAVSYAVNSDNQILATSPTGSGTVDVVVTAPGGTSPTSSADHFAYSLPPVVIGISPSSGPVIGGTIVTINGANFTGVTAVHFGAVAASFTFVNDGSMTATAPAGSGTIDITVTTPVGTSETGAADGFTYVTAPSVTSVSPSNGPASGGTVVTITGTNFSGVSGVSFGGSTALFQVNSATSISALSPTGNSVVNVTVTTSEGGASAASASDLFTYGSATNRSWVSAVSGNDSNPCTVTSPCLTLAAALTNTTAGGEIDVLTPGDYGPVTITKAISIYNDGAGIAGALTTSGTSGITVNAGANDTINLRGLSFNGLTASGASGVVFNSGAKLHIEKCMVQGFSTSGITFAPGAGSAAAVALDISDTTLINNGTGLSIRPTGGIAANVALRRVKLDKNIGGGLSVDGTDGGGAINAALVDSSASLNTGNGITATGGPNGVTLNMMRVVAASNGAVGIQSSQSDGGTATVTVGESTVYGNAVGVQSLDGGALLSYATTQLTGNASNGSFTGSATLQ
jgi:hypothetical protein